MVRKKKEPNHIDAMLDDLLADCEGPEDILGEAGLLKQLSQRLVERALAGELSHHLAHDEQPSENASRRRNSRNGYSKKTVQSTQGDLDLSIPRDRNGDFEPILVPKHQRRLSGLDEKILALYARGTSTRDISAQLEELYGANVSASLISDQGFAANPLPPPPKEPRKRRGRIRRSTPRNLLERLKTHQVPVLRFIYDFTVPFDNNQAERDLRMMKLKQKISGGFRSQDGARCFCRIRGYLATLHKQNRNLLDALLNLFSGNPQSPLPQPE